MYIIYTIKDGRKEIIQMGVSQDWAHKAVSYLKAKGHEVYAEDITLL